jgi:ribonuclease HII
MLVCGVDEAGRGPLVGAVFAAAVILNPARPIVGLADSKKLSEKQREILEVEIKTHALAWSIAYADAAEIDRLNILHATLLAMQRAVEGLQVQPQRALIDGNRCPRLVMEAQAIIKGDATVAEISAASILAKTARDAEMRLLHARFPQYGFDQHKGYPTPAHFAALQQHGACPEHRRSFAPVARVLDFVKGE